MAGNVRQLENAVAAAVIRATGNRPSRWSDGISFRVGHARETDDAITFQEATRASGRFLAGPLETRVEVVETARRLDLARSHL